MPAVTVFTQVYNTKPYLEQCVSSVLSQTYEDFQFLIIDNGCTDGSSELLEQFALQDSRINLIQKKKNDISVWYKELKTHYSGRYLADIDSDDWWEPDFLEHMIKFLEENDLDLATTGTMYYQQEEQRSGVLRRLEKPVILTQKQFAQEYPNYCMYPNTVWGSVMKSDLFWKAGLQPLVDKKYPFGLDTICMLEYIKQCDRIGIDNSALYHYRIQPKGLTCQYSPLRFDGLLARRDRIGDFLTRHQAMPPAVREWWMVAHLVYMKNTLKVLRDSDLTGQEKLKECARFASEPMTPELLRGNFSFVCDSKEGQQEWKAVVWDIILQAAGSLTDEAASDLSTVLRTLCPKCCGAIRPKDILLFKSNRDLRTALLEDDPDKLVHLLLKLMMDGQGLKEYEIEKLVQGLIPAGSPLKAISDPRFFCDNAELCLLILAGNYLIRLEDMTGSLLRNEIQDLQVDYLNLYVTLAALENQIPAFLFGKLRLAQVYLELGQKEDCQRILDDLEKMGMAENEELLLLHKKLAED